MSYQPRERAFLRDLGLRIRRIREDRDWSQETFAFQCDLHRTYLGAVERGERNVSALNLRKMAAALGVPLADFFPTNLQIDPGQVREKKR